MSKLRFPNLLELIPDMRLHHVEKEHYAFNYANQRIDCVFCICHANYELLVGIHALNFGFVLKVICNKIGKYVAEISDDDYQRFCSALNLTYRGNGFTSNALLRLLSEHTPRSSRGEILGYQAMREYTKCRHVDEADKIYFNGWNDHMKDGKRAHNFDKTEFYMGAAVANYCREHNISSRWTDIPRDEERYRNPWD